MSKVFKILSTSAVIVSLISGTSFGQQVFNSGLTVGIAGKATQNIELVSNDNKAKFLRMWAWAGAGNWGNTLIQDGDQTIMYTDALVIGKFPASGTFNSQCLRIDGNGNIGVGVSLPAQKMHIKTGGANSLQYGIQLQNPNGTDAGGTATGILFSCEGSGNFGKGGIVYERTGPYGIGSIHFLQNSVGDVSNAGMGNVVMTIANNGNVGIGVKPSSNKLAVNGNTAIYGTLRAKELIAEATLTVWPDYVFNKSYKATPLSQTESFITKNGHLPGIPSQAEVAKNGVNIVDLQAKMLKTMEEMTLQMIALKKENDQLKQRMDQLAKK